MTLYMGSRDSTQFARCYTMRGPTRFEVELKDDRAAQVMELLCDVPDSLPDVRLGVIRQFVDFVDLDDEKRERLISSLSGLSSSKPSQRWRHNGG